MNLEVFIRLIQYWSVSPLVGTSENEGPQSLFIDSFICLFIFRVYFPFHYFRLTESVVQATRYLAAVLTMDINDQIHQRKFWLLLIPAIVIN